VIIFNAVDLHDRYWYNFPYNYKVKNWKIAFLFNIMKVGLINSWVLHCELLGAKVEAKAYIHLVAKYLLDSTNIKDTDFVGKNLRGA